METLLKVFHDRVHPRLLWDGVGDFESRQSAQVGRKDVLGVVDRTVSGVVARQYEPTASRRPIGDVLDRARLRQFVGKGLERQVLKVSAAIDIDQSATTDL